MLEKVIEEEMDDEDGVDDPQDIDDDFEGLLGIGGSQAKIIYRYTMIYSTNVLSK